VSRIANPLSVAREKTSNVTEMVRNSNAKVKIAAEIQRCVVLCANCHRKEHADGS
jgi:hypothetical protein